MIFAVKSKPPAEPGVLIWKDFEGRAAQSNSPVDCCDRERPNRRSGASQVLSPQPNKVDSFDTRVSETINLFLFAPIPVAQGFSDLCISEKVSLWVFGCGFSPLWMPSFCIDSNHAETFLRGIVSLSQEKFQSNHPLIFSTPCLPTATN